MELATRKRLAIGNGILTVEDEEQAWAQNQENDRTGRGAERHADADLLRAGEKEREGAETGHESAEEALRPPGVARGFGERGGVVDRDVGAGGDDGVLGEGEPFLFDGVAGGGLLLTRGLDMEAARPAQKTMASETADGVVWRWALLVFVSGFLIVALQIVWYRLIGVLLQSNGYSFSLVLTVFLLGDAAGLLVGARFIDRIADPR
eukprot:gene30309-52422_t